jgi:hypothetical protein
MRPHGEYKTMTVRRSWSATTASGDVALILDTAEMGPIAFRVDEQTVGIIRRELSVIEGQLARRPSANSVCARHI